MASQHQLHQQQLQRRLSSSSSSSPSAASSSQPASLSPRPIAADCPRPKRIIHVGGGGGSNSSLEEKRSSSSFSDRHQYQQQQQVRIIRPTPRRPQQQQQLQQPQVSSPPPFTSSLKERRSLTDPRQIRHPQQQQQHQQQPHSLHPQSLVVPPVAANPVKLRSLSPGAEQGGMSRLTTQTAGAPPLIQTALGPVGNPSSQHKKNFVTSVTIDKSNSSASNSSSSLPQGSGKEDKGYRILSSRDEEAERDGSGPASERKPARKSTKSTAAPPAPPPVAQGAGGVDLLDVKAAMGRLHLNRREGGEADGEGEEDEEEDEDLSAAEKASTSSYSSDDAAATAHPRQEQQPLQKQQQAYGARHHEQQQIQGVRSSKTSSSVVLPGSRKQKQQQHHQPSHQQHIQQQQHEQTAAAATEASTAADEFVWIDSHNRLVELQQLPWTPSDVAAVAARVLHLDVDGVVVNGASSPSNGIAGVGGGALSPDALPRVSYYLQRALVRLAREAQRLSRASVGRCGRREVSTAARAVLSPTLAVSAARACLRSAAMFFVAGEDTRQSKSERAGLTLRVGRMHQWMCLVKRFAIHMLYDIMSFRMVGKFVDTLAAVYLTASVEAILEDLVTQCASSAAAAAATNTSSSSSRAGEAAVTAILLEQVIASRGDLWGLFQPYAHLSSSRIASGTLVLSPRFEALLEQQQQQSNNKAGNKERSVRQILLTTCVGSTEELEEMVLIAGGICQKAWNIQQQQQGGGATPSSPPPPFSSTTSSSSSSNNTSSSLRSSSTSSSSSPPLPPRWGPGSVPALYHFMRCSQLEYVGQSEGRTPIQELVYERPYLVLPPVAEWVRCALAFALHRGAGAVDADDVSQAARVLLPGCDCPPRPVLDEQLFNPFFSASLPTNTTLPSDSSFSEQPLVDAMRRNLAYQMLLTGRRDLVPHAMQLMSPSSPSPALMMNQLPSSLQRSSSSPSSSSTAMSNSSGLTPLHVAAAKGNLSVLRVLLETGACGDVDAVAGEGADEDLRHWTPLTYAAITGQVKVVKFLLDRGARVDGHPSSPESPLQVAAGAGNVKAAELLIAHGASPFAEHQGREESTPASRSVPCPSPVSVAAIHGHRRLLHVMVTQSLSLSKMPPAAETFANPRDMFQAAPGGGHRGHDHHHPGMMDPHRQQKQKQKQKKKPSGNKPADDEEVLSLEEILAEGAQFGSSSSDEDGGGVTGGGGGPGHQHGSQVPAPMAATKHERNISTASSNGGANPHFSKQQLKKLQEAMYHASESAHLELVLDLRNLGVSWTAHTWVSTLRTAHDSQAVPVINELLQDFCPEWVAATTGQSLSDGQSLPPQPSSAQLGFFSDMGLPLLFSVFRACKNEATVLVLADIFAVCFGRHRPLEMRQRRQYEEPSTAIGSRIDPKFVNNPELSDVQFRVEGRIFYAHKLALISASQRFQSMLNSRFCEGSPPVLQINDIRYDIFHLVMTYLYHGGLSSVRVEGGDVLELMAAANFFQLPGLLRHCEALCARLVDLENIVSYYIHAKVYQALDLLHFCEGFLLKNLVALLTYDDEAVKRLLFGKKLQNHDVLGGLMRHLQERIRNN